jgi:transglycosylase-like protein with SLT domain
MHYPASPGLVILPLLLLAAPAAAQEDEATHVDRPAAEPAHPDAPVSPSDSLCLMMESAAAANGLPLAFFVRLIWRESRFEANAVGPVTRSGERAHGIAQFMPRTAAERGLVDPHDPIAALSKSAELLRDLRREFGNLGLAAAAYNAGARRVHDWLDGAGGLPGETRAYVRAITGRDAEDWKGAQDGSATDPAAARCPDIVAGLKHAPDAYVADLERRITAGATKPWGVELFAGFSRDRAIKAYAVIEARYRETLAGTDSIILRGHLRSRGTRDFYQVRAGTDTRNGAERLCARLRMAGAACLVLRNSRGTAEAIGATAKDGEANQ